MNDQIVSARNPVLIIICILFSQLIFAILIAPILEINDFFPYHKWALFAKARKGFAVPIVYIQSYGKQKLSQEMNYYDFYKNRGDINFLAGRDHLIWWHEALVEKKYARAAEEFKAFKDVFFKNIDATFVIHYQDIDQIEFRKTRTVKKTIETFGPFESQDPSERYR